MPLCMVLLQSPKTIYINEKNEIAIVLPDATKYQLGSAPKTMPTSRSRAGSYAVPPIPAVSIEAALKISPSAESLSTVAIVETKVPPNDSSSVESTVLMKNSTVDDELVEVDIHGQIMKTLEDLLNERYLSIRPIIVEDGMIGYIQATVLCEREYVNEVAARVELIGIGSLIGSISVVNLDASRCAKPFRISEVSVTPKDDGNGSIGGNPDSAKDTVEEAVTAALTERASAAAAAAEGIANNKDNDPSGFDSKDDQQQLASGPPSKKRLSGQKVFMDVAGQLQIERVVEQIRASAILNFDYLSLLLIASVIAGVGLATNSTVAIVAAMLVSPLMGPVLAMTFGSNILDYSLIKLGLVSELLSLAICVVMGFVIGLCVIAVGTEESWPTQEMKTRGQVSGLLVGLAIAVPSGLGVALSVLGNNTSSLVGVAISLSLLPPAVNCGLALAYAAIGFQADSGAVMDGQYSTVNEYLDLGGISLALTTINIGAIYVTGCLMFRLKEVAPVPDKAAFWQNQASLFRERQLRQVQLTSDELDAEHQALLEAVGQDTSLRKKLTHWAQDDSLLGMTSGGALSGLLSASSTPMKARRGGGGGRARGGSDPANDLENGNMATAAADGDSKASEDGSKSSGNSNNKKNKKKVNTSSNHRPITLLELFRDEFADNDDQEPSESKSKEDVFGVRPPSFPTRATAVGATTGSNERVIPDSSYSNGLPPRSRKAMSLNLRDPASRVADTIHSNYNSSTYTKPLAPAVEEPLDSKFSELNIKQRLRADGKRKSVRTANLHYRTKTVEHK